MVKNHVAEIAVKFRTSGFKENSWEFERAALEKGLTVATFIDGVGNLSPSIWAVAIWESRISDVGTILSNLPSWSGYEKDTADPESGQNAPNKCWTQQNVEC